MASMVQQIRGVVAGSSHLLVFSRPNIGQSSSSNKKQPPQPPKILLAHEISTHMKGKAPTKQVCVPKKKKEEVFIVRVKEVGLLASITIDFAKCTLSKLMNQL